MKNGDLTWAWRNTSLSFHLGTDCIVSTWKLWISLSNSEWIWVCTLCYKSREVNYSVVNIHINCVRWELGSRGHQPFGFIWHSKQKARRKHWHCPFIVTYILTSLQLITLVSNPVPRASSMHGANRAGSAPNIRIFHVVGHKFRLNHLSLLSDRCHQHNKEEGQQNYVYAWFRALWFSSFI